MEVSVPDTAGTVYADGQVDNNFARASLAILPFQFNPGTLLQKAPVERPGCRLPAGCTRFAVALSAPAFPTRQTLPSVPPAALPPAG